MWRLLPFLFMVAPFCSGHAQLEKLFIDGRFIDAATGVPIINAQLMVTDSLLRDYAFSSRASADGEFKAALFSGAHYVLRFTAEGYVPRCAVVDLKMDRDWPDVRQVWHMNMPMPMDKAEGTPMPSSSTCDWRCVFQPRTSKLEWTGVEARERFAITVEQNERSPEELELRYERGDNRFLLVKGNVRELRSDKEIKDASVRFMPENGLDSTVTTDAMGYYEMKMTYEMPFRVSFSAEGKVSKIVEIDPRGVPGKERKLGFMVWTDITLFAPVPGADLGFLAEPIGRSAYDAKSGTMEWDMDYSLPIMERLNAILEGH